MRILNASFLSLICLLLVGCYEKQSPEELKQRTAEATQAIKQDTKAVVEGVRQGLSKDRRVNLNTASKGDLMSLPGMTGDWAEGIVAERPYYAPSDLLKRRVLPKSEYVRIADRVTTSGVKPNPGM
jgi:DNA uptake protein ComE-like DNA-binding protein